MEANWMERKGKNWKKINKRRNKGYRMERKEGNRRRNEGDKDTKGNNEEEEEKD